MASCIIHANPCQAFYGARSPAAAPVPRAPCPAKGVLPARRGTWPPGVAPATALQCPKNSSHTSGGSCTASQRHWGLACCRSPRQGLDALCQRKFCLTATCTMLQQWWPLCSVPDAKLRAAPYLLKCFVACGRSHFPGVPRGTVTASLAVAGTIRAGSQCFPSPLEPLRGSLGGRVLA
jgi:hypothetical protein